MALVSMRQLLDYAAEHQFGVPAFNVNNLEQTRAIMEAAAHCDAPVIMQASAGARKYAGAPFLRALMEAAVTEFPDIPIVVHQDHGTSPAVCQRSIQLGFTSVMMDGSLGSDGKTPMDYDYNARVTAQVVGMSHACGVSVEGELGCLGSLETGEAGEEDGVGSWSQTWKANMVLGRSRLNCGLMLDLLTLDLGQTYLRSREQRPSSRILTRAPQRTLSSSMLWRRLWTSAWSGTRE